MLNSTKNRLVVFILVSVSILLIVLNISLGIKNYNFSEIMSAFNSNLAQTLKKTDVLTITQIRMPRAIVGFFVGSNLALSGLIIQSITQNRLTSSQILGVNSGVIFVSVLCLIYLTFINYLGRTLLGVLAALFVMLVVMKLSKNTSKISIANLPLAGLVIGIFLLSLTQGILLLNEEASETIMFYMIGSFIKSNMESLYILIPISILCLLFTLILSNILKIIGLGNEMASSLGVNINKYIFIFILIVSILAGVSVSIAGPIGFVGIIVPNLVKKVCSNNYKYIILITFLLGGILTSASDLLSKFITYPYEVPVGIIISFIGVPIFLFIAMDNKLRGK